MIIKKIKNDTIKLPFHIIFSIIFSICKYEFLSIIFYDRLSNFLASNKNSLLKIKSFDYTKKTKWKLKYLFSFKMDILQVKLKYTCLIVNKSKHFML